MPLSGNASLGINPNIETYFFAEKLAVEHIDHYVFNNKGVDYSHQPIVHFGFAHFRPYQNDPLIVRVAAILKEIRDSVYDNGPTMDYLLNQRAFPAKGPRFPQIKSKDQKRNKLSRLLPELADSLRRFYVKAGVAEFLRSNKSFYDGALAEVAKDINKGSFTAIQKWYGQKYAGLELYISPAMPITPGDDAYRGYGPTILTPQGKIPSMMISSSKMLKLQPTLSSYHQYGFDNQQVTSFITNHEISHAFVNHLLDKYAPQIKADSALMIKELTDKLAPFGTRDWYTCVNEHLVRLGEIRVALAMGKPTEARRLRKLHVQESNFVLIPLLEEKILAYENNRQKYPTYESYLPQLVSFLHKLRPEDIRGQMQKVLVK